SRRETFSYPHRRCHRFWPHPYRKRDSFAGRFCLPVRNTACSANEGPIRTSKETPLLYDFHLDGPGCPDDRRMADVVAADRALPGRSLFLDAAEGGVSFFFVLSGFILTYNYADVFRDGISAASYKRFIWDRLTKIYPVHFLALLLVLPIATLSPQLRLDWRAVPLHLLLLQCFWPSSTPAFSSYLNVPSWSISCEWFFYLLGPVVMFLASGNR